MVFLKKGILFMSLFLVMVLSAFMSVGAPQPYLLDVALSEGEPVEHYVRISDNGMLDGFDSCHRITGLVAISRNSYTPTNIQVSDPVGECDPKVVALASSITGVSVTYEVEKTSAGVKISTYPGLAWNVSGDTRMEKGEVDPEGSGN